MVEQDPVSTPPENKLEPFTALDIDVGIGDIRMEEGDGWYLSLTSGGQDGDGTPYRLNHSQSGDTLDWSGCAVEGLLRAESGVGGLDVTAPVGEAELISGVGDVALRAAGSGADYAYQLTTGTGELQVDGEKAGPFFASGGAGDRVLTLSSGTGDVCLDFTDE